MKNLKTFALAAISLLGFAACQQVEITPDVKPEATHTVTFVAGAPDTKTTVDIRDGENAIFAWSADDVYRFDLYENSTRAELTQGTLTDGIMTIEAVFTGGVSAGENTYIAVYNSANDRQILYKEAYTEDADILVSKAISSFNESNAVQLQFKREVAIAKMTLKGLDAGEVVNHITVSSTADIAGSYDADGWNSTKTSLDIYSELATGVSGGYSIVANASGEAVVWFTCIPQDATTLTVKVEAADGDTYTKEFSSAIRLLQGDVTTFGVAMVKDAKTVHSYTIVFNSTVGSPESIKTSTKATTFVESGSEYLTAQPASGLTNAYYGGSSSGLPLRIGKSGEAGSITLALSESGQVPATKIILSAKQYYSGKTMAIGVNGSGKQQPGDNYSELSYDLDGSDISSIKLDTDGYIYVKSITVEYGGTIKTKLAAPANLKCSEKTETSLTFTWDAVTNADGYQVSLNGTNYGATQKETSYTIEGLKAGTSQTLYVKAIGNGTAYTDSEAVSATDKTLDAEGGEGGETKAWKLVTDASTLAVGDQLIIVSTSKGVAAGDIASSVMGKVAVTISKNEISSLPNEVVVLTLGGSTGAWTLANSDGQLLGATAVKKVAWGSGKTTWSISIKNNSATIQNGTSSYGKFLYNVDNPRFTTYTSNPASNMLLPEIYRYE